MFRLQVAVSERSLSAASLADTSRILIFIALHLCNLSELMHSADKGVAITKPIVFRQAESLFSLFSAAVPALNQYLRNFQTTGASTFGYSPNHSYGLKSYPNKSQSRIQHSHTSHVKEQFTPPENRGNYRATVEYENNKLVPSDDDQDVHSFGRHNSDDMIIRKDVAYEIAYSDGNRTK